MQFYGASISWAISKIRNAGFDTKSFLAKTIQTKSYRPLLRPLLQGNQCTTKIISWPFSYSKTASILKRQVNWCNYQYHTPLLHQTSFPCPLPLALLSHFIRGSGLQCNALQPFQSNGLFSSFSQWGYCKFLIYLTTGYSLSRRLYQKRTVYATGSLYPGATRPFCV